MSWMPDGPSFCFLFLSKDALGQGLVCGASDVPVPCFHVALVYRYSIVQGVTVGRRSTLTKGRRLAHGV